MAVKIGRPREPVLPRLLDRITIGWQSGCWIWDGSKNPNGYGLISVDGKYRLAHRVSYELFRGEIPDGLLLDHNPCDTRACIYPGHLVPTTHAVNLARGRSPAAVANRNGTCVSGKHDMTDVYVRANGVRQCRPCQLEKGAAYRDRKREKG